jgi:voltage-gated potassium channel
LPERPENRLFIAVALTMTIMVIGTVAYRFMTGDSYDWLTALYMVVITLATVGYGEVIDTSHHPAARIFTIVFILFGMGILLYTVSTVTSIMVEMDLRDVFKRRKMNKDIEKLRQHVILCGAGQTGTCIAQEMLKTGTSFVVIEREPERVEALMKLGNVFYILGDATDDDILLRAGIVRAASLAAALSTEKDNLFLTLTARQLNPSIRIVARGLDPVVDRKLRKAGADAVVSPTYIGGLRMASELIRPTVVSFLDTMLRDTSATIRFEEINISPNSRFINKTIQSTKLRDHDLLVVALRKAGSSGFIYNPPADTILTEGTRLVVLGESNRIRELGQIFNETQGAKAASNFPP